MCCSADCFLGFIAILFPPLPVWVKRGLCSADSLINILLCVLGYIPGLLHSWYIIAKYDDPYDEYEQLSQQDNAEAGRVRYVFVNQQPGQQHQPMPQSQRLGVNYGTNQASSSSAPQQSGGEGSSNNPPPTYAEAIKGDNKIQTHD